MVSPMNSDAAQRLHDRATRGEALTAEEHGALEQWYAREDRAEAALFESLPATPEQGRLHGQVQATLDQLGVVTARIQALSVENDAVRRENADLRQRLTQRSPSPTA